MKLRTDEAISWVRACHFLNVMAGLAAMSAAAIAGTVSAANPLGDWLTKDGDAVIRITDCEEALCGTIAWVKKPGTDRNNPDPARRDDDIVGVRVLLGMKPVAENRWEGQVYNAENGKNYLAYITLVEPDVLKIQGCVLGGLFCGGEKWTRQLEPLPGEVEPTPQEGGPTPLTQANQ